MQIWVVATVVVGAVLQGSLGIRHTVVVVGDTTAAAARTALPEVQMEVIHVETAEVAEEEGLTWMHLTRELCPVWDFLLTTAILEILEAPDATTVNPVAVTLGEEEAIQGATTDIRVAETPTNSMDRNPTGTR